MAHVQTPAVFVNGTEAGSGARAFGSNVATGNMIVVCIGLFHTGGSNISSITDTLSNVYTQVVTSTAIADVRLSIWRAKNIGGGANTVTVNVSPNAQITFTCSELSGRDTTEPNDANNLANGSSTAPSVSVTTIAADTDMIGTFTHGGANMALTSGAGYALLAENEGGSADVPLHAEFQNFTSAGAKTVNGTLGTSAAWIMLGASFKANATQLDVVLRDPRAPKMGFRNNRGLRGPGWMDFS